MKDLIKSHSILGVGAAPVCSSLSRAITPPWRSREFPEGLPGLPVHQQVKVDQGNSFAAFVAEVAQLCIEFRLPFWIDNPWASFLWSLPELVALRTHSETGFWLFDFCRFNTPWRKRTRVLQTLVYASRKLCVPAARNMSCFVGDANRGDNCSQSLRSPIQRH